MCELKKQEFFEDLQQNIEIDVSENVLYSGIYCGFESGREISEKKEVIWQQIYFKLIS